jgi:hypothetical protein
MSALFFTPVDTDNNSLLCCFCLEPFTDPVELSSCRHLLCLKCYSSIATAGNAAAVAPTMVDSMPQHTVACPTCRAVSTGCCKANRVIVELAQDVKVECSGCKAVVGPWRHRMKHVCGGSAPAAPAAAVEATAAAVPIPPMPVFDLAQRQLHYETPHAAEPAAATTHVPQQPRRADREARRAALQHRKQLRQTLQQDVARLQNDHERLAAVSDARLVALVQEAQNAQGPQRELIEMRINTLKRDMRDAARATRAAVHDVRRAYRAGVEHLGDADEQQEGAAAVAAARDSDNDTF